MKTSSMSLVRRSSARSSFTLTERKLIARSRTTPSSIRILAKIPAIAPVKNSHKIYSAVHITKGKLMISIVGIHFESSNHNHIADRCVGYMQVKENKEITNKNNNHTVIKSKQSHNKQPAAFISVKPLKKYQFHTMHWD